MQIGLEHPPEKHTIPSKPDCLFLTKLITIINTKYWGFYVYIEYESRTDKDPFHKRETGRFQNGRRDG